MIGSTLLCLLLVSGWVAAWLHWTFNGEIRQFLFLKVFPKKWRNDVAPEHILVMSEEEFEVFVGMDSAAPVFIQKLLGCPGCFSNYVSLAGTALVVPAFLQMPWWTWFFLPLIWACGAWTGHRLHNYL